MRIWIDIDNSPHVPFFKPIIAALEARGDEIFISTRRYAQTLELLTDAGIRAHVIGEHAGSNPIRKVLNLLHRSWQLWRVVRSFTPDIALSHGSRALSICSRFMKLPNILFFDYEWTEMQIFKRCATRMVCPTLLPESALREANLPLSIIERYDGLKEELYVSELQPDEHFRASLSIPEDAIVVSVRPSSMTSNYHDRRSEDILRALLTRLSKEDGVHVLVSPRTHTDRHFVESIAKHLSMTNLHILERAVPGLQLLYHSDLVVSGGGTMNRESAMLGTPTYSMFTGHRPSIDSELASQGRLHFLEQPEDVDTIIIRKHTPLPPNTSKSTQLLSRILSLIDHEVGVNADATSDHLEYQSPHRAPLRSKNHSAKKRASKDAVSATTRRKGVGDAVKHQYED